MKFGDEQVISIIADTQTTVGGDESGGYVDINDMPTGGRRRLLTLTANRSTAALSLRTIRVRALPVLSLASTWFACCSHANNTQTKAQKCRTMDLQALEPKIIAVGRAFGNDYCDLLSDSSGRRRLLQVSAGATACYAGNYKPGRGNSPCYQCPPGSSTAQDATAERTGCKCLPGHQAVRVDGHLIRCTVCGLNAYRSPLQLNDSYCTPCPANTFAPTLSSAYCYCLAGYYMHLSPNQTQECLPCSAGFYCHADNTRIPCPANSYTNREGASTRADCKCFAPLYYGDLTNPTKECVYVKPGLNCSLEDDVARCPCARGWVRNEAGVCASSCKRGEYAVLGPQQAITRCVPCPSDTYSDGTDTVYIDQLPLDRQCVPCPPNSHTAGKGTPNLQGCACMGNFNGSCQLCLANQYYYSEEGCKDCPAGTSSPAASTGLSACMCPRGFRAMRADTIRCEPCPIGYYSTSVGFSCTACPPDTTTAFAGATSRLHCI